MDLTVFAYSKRFAEISLFGVTDGMARWLAAKFEVLLFLFLLKGITEKNSNEKTRRNQRTVTSKNVLVNISKEKYNIVLWDIYNS